MKCLYTIAAFTFLLASSAFAGGEAPKAFLRFHVQAVDAAEAKQSVPIAVNSPPQQIWVKKHAILTEKDIDSVEVIEGGKILLTFDLTGKGVLEESTSTFMNRILVVIFNGRVVYAPIIDTTLKDGRFLLPGGLSQEEVNLLKETIKRRKE